MPLTRRVITMSETWLECPIEHMVKPEDGYQEGDICPVAGDCSVSDSKGVLRKVEKSEERLKAGDKINQYMKIKGDIQEPEDVNIKYTPYEASYKLHLHLRDTAVRDMVRKHGREYVIELLEAHDKVYAAIPKHWQKFKENPYSLCLDCGKVCKSSRRRKIHKSKQHRRSIL